MVELVRERTSNTEVIRLAHAFAARFGNDLSEFVVDPGNTHEAAEIVWKDCHQQLSPMLSQWWLYFTKDYQTLKTLLAIVESK